MFKKCFFIVLCIFLLTSGCANKVDNNDTYLSSLSEIDGNIRRGITDADNLKVDIDDDDYLTKQGSYYDTLSTSYLTAYDEINKLNYQTDNEEYHMAISEYYKNGYDHYRGLADKYNNFKTIDDETAYREEIGDVGFDIGDDLRKAYENALDRLKINNNTNI